MSNNNGPSLWEKQSFLKCDVAIIGAGITGLSTAASLKEQRPDLDVLVLERGILPSGASTKNAGFACFGSVSELLNDIEKIGEAGTISLVDKRIKGLEKTKTRLGADAIDLQVNGGYELLLEQDSPALEKLDYINTLLKPLYNDDIYERSDHKIRHFGFEQVSALIENKYEGQLDTGKLIATLWRYCSSLGIRLHTGVEVTSIHYEDTHARLESSEVAFEAKKVAICTNAFSKKLLENRIDLNPGRGLVLSVVPEEPMKIKGTFHYQEGYFYFRDYYGKLIFGGGRNLDLIGETTTEFGINQLIKAQLIRDLEHYILPNQNFKIEMEWSGIMAFGENKEPVIEKINEHTVIGVRLGGMGVAIGSLVGESVAKNILLLL